MGVPFKCFTCGDGDRKADAVENGGESVTCFGSLMGGGEHSGPVGHGDGR